MLDKNYTTESQCKIKLIKKKKRRFAAVYCLFQLPYNMRIIKLLSLMLEVRFGSTKLCGLLRREYLIEVLFGSSLCNTCSELLVIILNSRLSLLAQRSWNVGAFWGQKPYRVHLRVKDSSRCISCALANPCHALAAYCSLATATDLKIVCSELSLIPCALRVFKANNV